MPHTCGIEAGNKEVMIMTKEKGFVQDNMKRIELEEYMSKEFSRAGYSHSEIQRTPLATRIVIWAQKPGLVIGRGGKNIENMTRLLKSKFGIDNPQLDVQEIENPDLDAEIVSKQIKSGIERGLNYKRIANLTIRRVMESGAVGIAIRISGKIGGAMGRVDKFSSGYLKYAGDPAETLVSKAYSRAQVKLGTIGIQVRILVDKPSERMIMDIISQKRKAKEKKEEANKTVKKEIVEEKPADKPKEESKKEIPKEEAKPEEKPAEEKIEKPADKPKEESKKEIPKEEAKPEEKSAEENKE